MAFSVSYVYNIVDSYSGKLGKIRNMTSKFTKTAKKAQHATKNFSDKMQGMQSSLSSIIGVLGGATALNTFNDYATSMNKLNAVTLGTSEQMAQMGEMAKNLGSTTQFSAGQAAQGMTFLAMAGLDTEEVLKAIPGALQLAAAGGIDLASAADISTNVLKQMGLGVKDLAKINDVLSLAQAKSNTSVLEAADALKNVGTFASSAGIDIEQLTGMIGAMADAGEKGGQAGTLLRNAFQDMVTPGRKQLKVLRKMDIDLRHFVTRTGKIKNIPTLIDKINKSGANAGKIMVAFGDRGGRAILALSKSGGARLKSLTEKMRNAGGTAQRMAEIQMQGIPGLLKTIKSVAEGLVIALFESGLDKFLIDVGNKAIEFIREISQTNPKLLKWAGIIGAAVIAGGPFLIILGMMAGAVSSLIGLVSGVGSIIGTIFVAATSPVGLAILAIGGIIAAIEHWDVIKDIIKRTIEDPIGMALLAFEKLKSAYESVKNFGMNIVSSVKGFFGMDESVSAKNAAVKQSNLNGRIDVVGSGGAKVKRAEMSTDMPGNLGFNLAPAGG